MRRIDRLKAVVSARRQSETRICAWPTWTIPAHTLARIEDGTVQQVALSWADGARVWVARSGQRFIACGPVGRATPEEIAAWCQAKFAELARQHKAPPARERDLVSDVFRTS